MSFFPVFSCVRPGSLAEAGDTSSGNAFLRKKTVLYRRANLQLSHSKCVARKANFQVYEHKRVAEVKAAKKRKAPGSSRREVLPAKVYQRGTAEVRKNLWSRQNQTSRRFRYCWGLLKGMS